MGDTFELKSPFVCGKHDFKNDTNLSLKEQEEALYQHFRDVEHETNVSKPCQQCGKKVQKTVVAKVPQPTAEIKNPRSPIVFCDENCSKAYLSAMGVEV